MTNLPRTLVERAVSLPMADLNAHMPVAAEAAASLEARNFVIRSGLTEDLIGQVAAIARQPHIGGPYPEDRRMWADKDSVAAALGQGMAAFVLLASHPEKPRPNVRYVAGYGLVQNRRAENVNGGHAQFAIRIREAWRGQQLSVDFGRAALGVAKVAYGVHRVWGEFWGDDRRAVHLSRRLGFGSPTVSEEERYCGNERRTDHKIRVALNIRNLLNHEYY